MINGGVFLQDFAGETALKLWAPNLIPRSEMAGGSGTKVVQITNIAPQATKDQMQSLFGHIGKIDEIRLYPTIRDVSCPVVSRICYVKFFETSCVAVAQHLTNTVFIDRALIVIPVQGGLIPDEYKALEMAANGTLVPGLHNIDGPCKLPPEVVNRIDGMVPNQVGVASCDGIRYVYKRFFSFAGR